MQFSLELSRLCKDFPACGREFRHRRLRGSSSKRENTIELSETARSSTEKLQLLCERCLTEFLPSAAFLLKDGIRVVQESVKKLRVPCLEQKRATIALGDALILDEPPRGAGKIGFESDFLIGTRKGDEAEAVGVRAVQGFVIVGGGD